MASVKLNGSAWNTTHELEFLDNIGTSTEVLRKEHKRRDILKGYIASMTSRKDWRKIDKRQVATRAKKLLKEFR